MNTITLADLRADFEAAREAFCLNETARMPGCSDIDDELRQWPVEEVVTLPTKGCSENQVHLDQMLLAAWVYLIAHRYGVNAAMLFKLSGGNIDPRNKKGE